MELVLLARCSQLIPGISSQPPVAMQTRGARHLTKVCTSVVLPLLQQEEDNFYVQFAQLTYADDLIVVYFWKSHTPFLALRKNFFLISELCLILSI